MKGANLLAAMATLMLSGCIGGLPAEWAFRLEIGKEPGVELKCGMSVAEVAVLAGEPVVELMPPIDWRTHYIRRGDTFVLLGFENGKLGYDQITWPVKGRMAISSTLDLCAPGSGKTYVEF